MPFQVPHFEARVQHFTEAMLSPLWEIALDNFKSDTAVQETVTESYTNFLEFVKSHAYYEALQLSYHGYEGSDTPGRQLEEDYEELCALVG
jgi:hypothetical protein